MSEKAMENKAYVDSVIKRAEIEVDEDTYPVQPLLLLSFLILFLLLLVVIETFVQKSLVGT